MNILVLSLWAVCFFDALILLCLPTSEKLIFSTDGSAARYVVDFMCLAIGLTVLFTQGWKKLPSKAIGVMLLVMLVSHFHSPHIIFDGTFLPPDHAIFNYKPMFEAILFFMLFMGIVSMKITTDIKDIIRQTFVWIPTIYAAFAVLQRAGLDQLYMMPDKGIEHLSRNPEVGGFISQPVFCAAMIAVCVPFVIRYGQMWQLIICLLGILATGNRSALIAVGICMLYRQEYRLWGKVMLGAYASYLILGVVLQFYPHMHLPYMNEERFAVWAQVLRDFLHPQFPGISNSQILTGTGIGSFAVIFPFYHHSAFYQAHNEFLEALRCLGVVGFGVMFYCLGKIPESDPILMNALLASCILALTNAIWHIPQLAFLTVVIIALLYHKHLGASHVETC